MTMRPSDVPTYVEAGAADVGITGKDVLTEQSERDVYELLDLGYGPCRMIVATVDGEDPMRRGAAPPRRHADRDEVPQDRRAPTSSAPAARPRSSRSRARSSSRRSPASSRRSSTSPPPGRRCARTAWSIREEIFVSHRAADRQPGRPQAQGAAIDEHAWSGCVRVVSAARDARPPLRAADPGRRVRCATRSRRSSTRGARPAATRRWSSSPSASTAATAAAARDRRATRRRRRRAATPTCAPGWSWRSPTSRAVAGALAGRRRRA